MKRKLLWISILIGTLQNIGQSQIPQILPVTYTQGTQLNWEKLPSCSHYILQFSPIRNFVKNSGFLEGSQHWTCSNEEFQIIRSPELGYCIDVQTSSTLEVNQRLVLESGRRYYLSFVYYIDTTSEGSGFRVWTTEGSDIKLPSSRSFYKNKGEVTSIQHPFTTTSEELLLNFRFYANSHIRLSHISILTDSLSSLNFTKRHSCQSPYYILDSVLQKEYFSYKVCGIIPGKDSSVTSFTHFYHPSSRIDTLSPSYPDTVYIRDSIFIPDTNCPTDIIFIPADTICIRDTLFLLDTIIHHDTIILHDTITRYDTIILHEVNNIAELKDAPTGEYYCLSSLCHITHRSPYRNQIWIEDNSAGILIDDPQSVLDSNWQKGDHFQFLQGQLCSFNFQRQFLPLQMDSFLYNAPIHPPLFSIPDIKAQGANLDSRLVRINGLKFLASGQFQKQLYYLSDGNDTLSLYPFLPVSEILGQEIPQGFFDLIALVKGTKGQVTVCPRSMKDFLPSATTEIPSSTGIRVYPNPSRGEIFIQGMNLKSIEIFDPKGKSICFQEVPSFSNSIQFYRKGIFLLKIQLQTGDFHWRKIVII